MTSIKHMKRLIMDRNNLKSHTRNNHFQQIMQRINYLSFVRCNLTDETGVYLAQGIQSPNYYHSGKSNFSGCTTLIAHHNNIGDEAARYFADHLSKINLGILHLDLSHN